MNTKVNTNELVSILKVNREKHRAIFLEAQEGFRKVAIEALEKRLADAREGKRIQLYLELIEPADQTKDYDRVIQMLQMSTESVTELSEREFAQYVQDDWQWKQNFLHANSTYSATAQAMLIDSSK